MIYNVKTLYRRTIEEATQQQIFSAVALATKDAIIDAWLATQEQMKKQDPKIVYYMSMEFLICLLYTSIRNMSRFLPAREHLPRSSTRRASM